MIKLKNFIIESNAIEGITRMPTDPELSEAERFLALEHVEIEEGVDSWTGENLFRIGYSLVCEGEVECFTDEKTGRRHARIYK